MDLASGGSGNSLVYVFGSKSRFFEIVGNKIQKSIENKKTNSEKSVLQTGFCHKRQTGNVLLIVIFVIRNFLTGTRPQKSQFY